MHQGFGNKKMRKESPNVGFLKDVPYPAGLEVPGTCSLQQEETICVKGQDWPVLLRIVIRWPFHSLLLPQDLLAFLFSNTNISSGHVSSSLFTLLFQYFEKYFW